MARPLPEELRVTMPDDSWWIDVDRDAFYQRVRLHANRMRHSTYGRSDRLVFGPTEDRPRKSWPPQEY